MPLVVVRFAAAVALLFGLATSVSLADTKPASESPLYWMVHAYENKDEDRVGSFIEWLGKENILDVYNGLSFPITVFLSERFRAQPDRVEAWIAPAASYGVLTRTAIEWALRYADRTDLAERLSDEKKAINFKSLNLRDTYPTIPEAVDRWWGAFWATGDGVYIRRLIDALEHAQSKNDEKTAQKIATTLSAHLEKHQKVADEIENEIKIRNAKTSFFLRMMKFYKKAKRELNIFVDYDGDFNARTIAGEYKNYSKIPEEINPDFYNSPSMFLKKNQEFFIKTIFSGQAVNDAQESHVVWDITITDPKRRLWSGPELKNLKALEGRVRDRFDVFEAAGSPILMFKDGDEPGSYTVTVNIRDEIGGKKIKLYAFLWYTE